MPTSRTALLLATVLTACGATPSASDVAPDDASDATSDMPTTADAGPGIHVPTERGYPTLAEYGLFEGSGATQRPVSGVIPYEVNAQLYADFAEKRRFLYVPPGARITFAPAGRWEFPVGAVLIKTFYYPRDARNASLGDRLLETRLLIRGAAGWFAETYRWNDAQTEAVRTVAGAEIPVTWTAADGTARSHTWVMPNRVECGRCHGVADPMEPNPMNVLGLRTGQLNRDHAYAAGTENQITHLASLGLFDTTPAAPATLERFEDPAGTGPVEPRARAYLHANCAHCHSRAADTAAFSGLYLNIENSDEASLGVCKTPSSASDTGGRRYDIVPGMPDDSVLTYRTGLERTTGMMPPLGRQLADPDGVAVLRAWIAAMPARSCQTP